MKLDYGFIKEILLAMEAWEGHEINNNELLKLIGQDQRDKFIGHIKLLGDNGFIDFNTDKTDYEYGFYSIAGVDGYNILDTDYRITAQGYEFLDMLKNDTVFNKIKDFTLSNAVTIGREIIIRSAVEGIKTITGQNFPSNMC